MSTLGSASVGGVDMFTVKLLLAALVLAVSTSVALAAAMVSRSTPASTAQSVLCAGAAFAGTATLLLGGIVSFTAF
ncbi:hypothetical protein [Streptomyces sp. NPDC002104]